MLSTDKRQIENLFDNKFSPEPDEIVILSILRLCIRQMKDLNDLEVDSKVKARAGVICSELINYLQRLINANNMRGSSES